MLSLRSFFAATVACSLLFAGPALAARTQPVGSKTNRPTAPARRSATARPGAAAKAAALAGSKGAPRTGTHAVAIAPPPAAAPTPSAQPVVAEPQLVCLTGVVLNPSGRPCPGVCVFPAANARQVAVTDAQGNFHLQVPAQMALSLQADYVGLGSSRVTIDSRTPQLVHMVLGR
ncbi:hypothetical protein A0257_20375 [Hymenobacter psoromatis]|nr:hypothetical protein A0257_20375 [Hymenobacter psoromatis]